MKYTFLLLFISGVTILFCSAHSSAPSFSEARRAPSDRDISALDSFQKHLEGTIDRVLPACVLITTQEHLTPSGGVMASGVVVSADGIVMTAGHMVLPGGKYKIIFPDSTQVEASGLGKIGMLDAGLLKITEPGNYPYAEMGASSSLQMGAPCFSLAYPGSFATKLVVRLGQVLEIRDDPQGDIRTRHIRTSCLMEPGDSGGPLFDLSGRVIGIRSHIGMSLDQNYEVPVDIFRKYWSALQTPVHYRQTPEADALAPVFPKADYSGFAGPQLAKQIQALEEELDQYCVVVTSTTHDSTKTVLGAVVDVRGMAFSKKALKHGYVVSKSSEVGSEPKATVNGKVLAAKVLFRDAESDLVLLQVDDKNIPAIALRNISDTSSDEAPLGRLLLSPNPAGEGEFSIYGAAPFKLPGVYRAGYLGMRLERKEGKNVVTSVQPNTAASMAMLRVGDEVLDIDRVKVDSPADFTRVLQKKKAREVVSLVRLRDGIQDTLLVQLQGRPFQGKHVADEFTDGRSERRDGFERVFIHDATLKPSQCGGPVFDLQGRFAGINIARYSRTSSLALPPQEVVAFLRTAFSREDRNGN